MQREYRWREQGIGCDEGGRGAARSILDRGLGGVFPPTEKLDGFNWKWRYSVHVLVVTGWVHSPCLLTESRLWASGASWFIIFI